MNLVINNKEYLFVSLDLKHMPNKTLLTPK